MKKCILLLVLLIAPFVTNAQVFRTISAEEVTEKDFSLALAAAPKYNQTIDTLISPSSKLTIRDLVANSLNDEEKYDLSWGDLLIFGIGRYPTGEHFALLWGPNYEDAVFIDPDRHNISSRITGSHLGTYSSKNIYAGYEVNNCDNRVLIHFYDTPKVGEKRLIAFYQNDEMIYSQTGDIPSLVWYQGDLYCRWESLREDDWGSIHYYKLQIER